MPKTYILRKPLPDAPVGTKLFFQDGRYYYKSNTEMDSWYHKMVVENMPEWFEEEQWQVVAYRGKYLGFNGVIFFLGAGDVFHTVNYPHGTKKETGGQLALVRTMEILQVKRHIDGETFAIGDNTNAGQINGFSIHQYNGASRMMMVNNRNNTGTDIMELKKHWSVIREGEDLFVKPAVEIRPDGKITVDKDLSSLPWCKPTPNDFIGRFKKYPEVHEWPRSVDFRYGHFITPSGERAYCVYVKNRGWIDEKHFPAIKKAIENIINENKIH